MTTNKKIWKRLTEKDHCFIIAEAGSNHNGNFETAKKMIDAANEAGVDAIKFQFFKANNIAVDTKHKIAKLENGKTLYQLYKNCETPREWISELVDYCKKKNIIFFATPFDEEAVDLLEKINVEIYKIASFEIVHIPLLKKIAKINKPLILSTGMADLDDIKEALEAIYSEGNKKVILLHCGINYPLSFDEVNLRAMDTIKTRFNLPVGYSDHSSGIVVPVAAVARGAQVIEKHFTLNKKMKGPDHGFAIEPKELRKMVQAIRECERCLGSSEKKYTKSEKIHYMRGRRSIFAAKNIYKGEVLTKNHLAILRPGIGLKPKYINNIIGKIAKKDTKKNEPIKWSLIK